MDFLKRLWNEEDGQGMVEYGLIIALIAVVLIAALGIMAGGLENIFEFIGGELNDATTP